MCGPFTLTDENRGRVAAALGVPVDQLVEEDYRSRWSIAPTDPHWIVRTEGEDRQLLAAKCELVQFGSTDAKRAASQINAPAKRGTSSPCWTASATRTASRGISALAPKTGIDSGSCSTARIVNSIFRAAGRLVLRKMDEVFDVGRD